MAPSGNARVRLFVLVGLLTSVPASSCDADPEAASSPSVEATPSAPGSETPSFRFSVRDRHVVATGPGHVSTRERRGALEAAETIRSLVTDLYVGAFLDPQGWGSGDYDEVFAAFAGAARDAARRRTGILTAGQDAGGRFDRIRPIGGDVKLEILLDRGGNPTLVASAVRFRARGTGAETVLIRSEGSFLFRRVEGAWRIVSFDVVRDDHEVGAG